MIFYCNRSGRMNASTAGRYVSTKIRDGESLYKVGGGGELRNGKGNAVVPVDGEGR
jgi:hypothetical protein